MSHCFTILTEPSIHIPASEVNMLVKPYAIFAERNQEGENEVHGLYIASFCNPVVLSRYIDRFELDAQTC